MSDMLTNHIYTCPYLLAQVRPAGSPQSTAHLASRQLELSHSLLLPPIVIMLCYVMNKSITSSRSKCYKQADKPLAKHWFLHQYRIKGDSIFQLTCFRFFSNQSLSSWVVNLSAMTRKHSCFHRDIRVAVLLTTSLWLISIPCKSTYHQ